MNNIFEQASRKKLRFSTNRGNITTEDLWDLSLDELDVLAISLNKQVKETSDESFVKKANRANKTLELQFNVVKSVIDTKLEEADKAKKRADLKSRQAILLQKIAEKQDAALNEKSLEELQKEFEDLEADTEE